MKKILLLMTFTVLISCNDFLEHSPDQRMEITTKEELAQLLVSAYANFNYAVLGELSSDNMIDNTAPDSTGKYHNLQSYDRMHEEMFAWEASSSSGTDSPSAIWESYYHAIAVCNHALEIIARMEKEGINVKAQKGEALISRAYHHFILVNIFCQAYKDENQTDLGIPYVTEPETKVAVHYNRGTVPEVYKNIEKDIKAGIGLIDDTEFEQEKYHFNKRAANAFAARFYLFKRDYEKVIDHADFVLGENPVFRNWKATWPTPQSEMYWWIDHSSPNNLLLMPTYSVLFRIFGNRYGCAREAKDGSLNAQGPSGILTRCHRNYYRGNSEYGSFLLACCGEFFEYTDKVAGIGYAHTVRTEFTTEETLLCRAEAKIHLNRKEEALADFLIFEESRNKEARPVELTEQRIISYFLPGRMTTDIRYHELNMEKMCPSWKIDKSLEPYLHCVLLYRRVETIHNGMRLFDIKRYGMEITHKIGKTTVDKLTWNDLRRAIQIPSEVISAELEPNPRLEVDKNKPYIDNSKLEK